MFQVPSLKMAMKLVMVIAEVEAHKMEMTDMVGSGEVNGGSREQRRQR